MPLERDNESERNDRIEQLLRQIRETQQRVEEMAAEGRQRARQIAVDRAAANTNDDSSSDT